MKTENRVTKEKTLYFLQNFFRENGYIPSIREICNELNVKSTSTIHSYLKELHESGKIIRPNHKKRAISLNFVQNEQIPLLGSIAAGTPILAEENVEEYVNIPANSFSSGELFMLTVKGDSMIDAGIYDRDKIVLRRQNTAENGEIVAVLLDDNKVTVKRLYKEDGYFRLKPENPTMRDILVEDLTVLGKVVGLIRAI